MICPKCKHEVRSNIHICPHCGNLVNTQKETVKEGVKSASRVKSKIVKEDESAFAGVTVSKSTLVTIQKRVNKKKEINRKDFNNYIDYKEARERALEEMNKPNSSKTRSLLSSIVQKEKINESGTVSGRAVRKSSQETNKNVRIVDKKNAINPLVSNNFGRNGQNGKKGSKKTSLKTIKIEKVNRKAKFQNFNNLISIGILILWIITVYYFVTKPELSYYFYENENDVIKETNNNTLIDEEMLQYESVSKSGQEGGLSREGVTAIVYDNQYLKQFTIKNESDVVKLISTDSVKQKVSCPNSITQIENEIVTNYGIIAANLCEMDESFALELRDVIRYIYNNYPSARNYLTNITLANVDEGATYMAAFMPVFTFATSTGSTGYPVGVKTQIILNSKYFLDVNKIKNSVNYGSKSGYFPPNATRSSSVAHEFGHFLSYIALLNHYDTGRLMFVKANESKLLYDVYQDFNLGNYSYELLSEAYNEYIKDFPGESFDEFRGSISKYALAKDGSGNYIYDETIAEAFHDVYLNGDKAKMASKYIVEVLERKL